MAYLFNRSILFLLLISTLLTVACGPEMETSEQEAKVSDAHLEKRSYDCLATGDDRYYYVYLPKGYHNAEDQKKWPVVFFLHGNGERGDTKEDLDYLLKNGPLYEAWIQKRDFPFVIVAPQLPMWGQDTLAQYIANRTRAEIPVRLEEGVPDRSRKWGCDEKMTYCQESEDLFDWKEDWPVGWWMMEKDLIGILDTVLNDYKIDENRQYITGLSYGGQGTWYMMSKYADRWAAGAPVVGWGDTTFMAPIAEAKLPVWCIAGGRDAVIHPQLFYPGINKLEELGHEVRFTVEEDMNHDVWTRVYGGQDIYDWLLSFSKQSE